MPERSVKRPLSIASTQFIHKFSRLLLLLNEFNFKVLIQDRRRLSWSGWPTVRESEICRENKSKRHRKGFLRENAKEGKREDDKRRKNDEK